MILLLALAIATGAKPKTDPGSWIGPDDYPKSELARHGTGKTEFTLTINRDGTVGDCSVTASSGSTVLDTTACDLLRARAGFEPAVDEDGRKIGSTYSSSVIWNIPEQLPLPLPAVPQVAEIMLDIDANGDVERCAVTQKPTLAAQDDDGCADFKPGRRLYAFKNAAGKPVAYRVTTHQTVTYQPR